VGAIEPQFYTVLLKGLGLDPKQQPEQLDQDSWPEMRTRFQEIFKTKTRAEWEVIFNALPDACATPVLTLDEVASHPHNAKRKTFYVDEEGHARASAAPRLSRTPGAASLVEPTYAEHTGTFLAANGISQERMAHLRSKKVILGEPAGGASKL